MRTTVTIDDELLRSAKELAVRSGRSLSAVLEDALRVVLANPAQRRREAATFSLPAGGRGGVRPGIDLDDKDALATLMDDDTPLTDASR